MLYSEFVSGTKCKETEENYNIYKYLEILYMNSDISKDKIYEFGKKLVNNDLTEEEKEHNARIQAEIDDLKEQIKLSKTWNNYYDIDVREARLKIKLLKNALYR